MPNTTVFGSVATENAQVAGISMLIGRVSGDRTVNPQKLKTDKEISPKLEKSLKSLNSSPEMCCEREFAETFRDGSISTNFCSVWPRDHDLC